MKRLMKAALALLLAMALTLVACDPKVDEPEPRHGEPTWREKPITVDNAAADIRAFFDEIEEYTFRIDLSPALPILNLVGRPLAQLGDSNKAALQTKLTDSGITAEWADGKLTLTEPIATSAEIDGLWHYKGEYEIIQDVDGNWSISVSRPDDAKWGFEATLAKDKEHGCFVSVKTNRDDPRNQSKNTFYPNVCAYNEVVLKSESVYYSKTTRTVDEVDVEVETKGIGIQTTYFIDKNIGDGDKIVEYESTDFEDGTKVEAFSETAVSSHDKNGILIFTVIDKTTYPNNCVEYLRKMWFPASDGQLQIPKALRDLGIPSFTIKAGSISRTFGDLDPTFGLEISYERITNEPKDVRCHLVTTKTLDDAKTMVLDAKNKDGQLVFRATVEGEIDYRDFDYVPIAPSPIKGIDISSSNSLDNVQVNIIFKDDPSTEANELAPFVALVD